MPHIIVKLWPGKSATGLTVCAVIITHAGAASDVAGLLTGWNSAVLVTVGFSLLGALAVFFTGERPASRRAVDTHTT